MYDCIVVGAGVEGSASAYHLAKMGKKTLLLEQFPLPHTRGSSHGASRITRKSYEQDVFVEMMIEAYELWNTLEKESNETLFINTGLLTIEDASTGVVQKCTEGLKKLNLPYESLSGHDIYKRFPTIEVPSTWIGVYDPDAGVLLADKCLAAYHSQFKANGGEIHDTEPMLEVIPSSTTVLVKTTKANYVAKSVVLCLGPWAKPALLKLSLDLPLRVAQITVCYWKCDDLEEYSAGGGFPCIFLNNELGHCYGLPAVEYPGLFKFCRHEGPLIDPNQRDAVQDELSIKIPAEYIKKHFKRMSPKPAIVEKCMYTWTPDKAFILDTHPQYKNVVFGAGFSGHGFKLSPVVGKVLAALAIGNIPEKYDMTLFKANRFNMAKL